MKQEEIIEKIKSFLPSNYWDIVEDFHPNYNSEDVGRALDLNQYVNDEFEDDEISLLLEKKYGKDNIPLEAVLADLKVYIEALEQIKNNNNEQ